jgi:hypothetical protein
LFAIEGAIIWFVYENIVVVNPSMCCFFSTGNQSGEIITKMTFYFILHLIVTCDAYVADDSGAC